MYEKQPLEVHCTRRIIPANGSFRLERVSSQSFLRSRYTAGTSAAASAPLIANKTQRHPSRQKRMFCGDDTSFESVFAIDKVVIMIRAEHGRCDGFVAELVAIHNHR
jgi:hypothetical protein